MPVALYGCENWSVTLWEEYRLKAYNDRVLGEIFGPNKDALTGEWRRLRNEELYGLYCSSNIIIRLIILRRIRWAGQVARMEDRRSSCRLFVGKSEVKSYLEDLG